MVYDFPVELAVYDLSRGMAKQLGPSLLGLDIEAIYHTGVRVYGYEYFFSNGIQKLSPTQVSSQFGMKPFNVISIGTTQVPEDITDCFVIENQTRFSEDTYNLLTHNCNNFSDEFVNFLTNTHIPDEIIDLPKRLLETPLGQQILPLLDGWGAIKAIPMTAEPPKIMVPSAPACEMDLSYLDVWKSPHIDSALIDLQQMCISNASTQLYTITKACFVVYEKTKNDEVSLYGIRSIIQFLKDIRSDKSWNDVIFRVLIILAPQLAIASKDVKSHGKHSEEQFLDILRLLQEIAHDNSLADSTQVASLVAITALCSKSPMIEVLRERRMLRKLIDTYGIQKERSIGAMIMCAAILGTIGRNIKVSSEGNQISEESEKLLNLLSSGLLMNNSVDVVNMRIAGLYCVLKHGGIAERKIVATHGIRVPSYPANEKNSEMYKHLLYLISHYICLL